MAKKSTRLVESQNAAIETVSSLHREKQGSPSLSRILYIEQEAGYRD